MEAGAGGDSTGLRHGADHRCGWTTLCNTGRRGGHVMTLLPPGVKVHLALSYIDMRKGIDGLAILVQRPSDEPARRPAALELGRINHCQLTHV
jgi:hypothetical protein